MHVTDKDRLRELAAAITNEQDPDKFSALVQELNELLEGIQTLKESRKDLA
jgi:hypothetical protein